MPLIRLAATPRHVTFAVVALLLLRALSIISAYFFEEDEVSLAVGIAALVADTPGNLYRYSVQLGYYRGIEGLVRLLGVGISGIPWVMKGVSAVASVALPVAGLFLFKRELPVQQRLLVGLVLALNPVVWQSGRYGNSALLSTALSAWALAWLSNPGTRVERLGALTLLGAAVLVRGDAAFLWPVAALLILWTTGSWKTATVDVGVTGGGLAAVYALILLLDPRADSASTAISQHMSSTPSPSMFWEYLLWALSPAPAVFAVWGGRRLLEVNPKLLGLVVVWALPTLIFYFRATTTTRYFLNVCAPLALLSAVGMADAARCARQWLTRQQAWGLIGAAASVHLFVALGHVPPPTPIEHFYGGTFTTHDGPMPTGALLARGLLSSGSLLRALPAPSFGQQAVPFWEGPVFNAAVTALETSPPGRTVVVRLSGGFGHAMHYHLHAAGARYDTGPRDSSWFWLDAIWLRLGDTRVFTVGNRAPAYRSMATLEVQPGDAVWLLGEGDADRDPTDLLSKLPAGLTLESTPSFDPHFTTFTVVHAGGRQEGGT